MRFKSGVLTSIAVQPVLLEALGRIEDLFASSGVEMVVTSLCDGAHGRGSLHFKGLAADLRTRDLPTDDAKKKLAKDVAEHLGQDFDVVLEATHLHIEYDP